jgi:hypothetical protein
MREVHSSEVVFQYRELIFQYFELDLQLGGRVARSTLSAI